MLNSGILLIFRQRLFKKMGYFDNFSVTKHAKFGIFSIPFVHFSDIFFGQKYLAPYS